MLAAALLASLLAQAEPAPVPTPTAGPAEPAPGPAEPAPAAAPPAGTPAPPTPSPASGPAAPAPRPGPPAATVQSEPSPPPNSVSVHFRYAYRLGSDGDAVAPTSGFSVGGEFERRLIAFRTGIEIGAAIDFFYDRFSKDVPAEAPGPSGELVPVIAEQTLSHNAFSLLETTAWRYADMRLCAGVGGGVSFGFYTNGGSIAQPLVRGVLGFDFAIATRTSAVLRIDYNHTFRQNTYTVAGVTYPLFGDTFDAGIGLLVRF